MDIGTKKEMRHLAEVYMVKNPPRLGDDFLDDRARLRVRMAYQRAMLMALAPQFPDIPMVDVVLEVVSPMMDLN